MGARSRLLSDDEVGEPDPAPPEPPDDEPLGCLEDVKIIVFGESSFCFSFVINDGGCFVGVNVVAGVGAGAGGAVLEC